MEKFVKICSMCLLPHLSPEDETDPVSETSCFLVSRIPDDGKDQKENSNSSPACSIIRTGVEIKAKTIFDYAMKASGV
jgi:hypothetical protein